MTTTTPSTGQPAPIRLHTGLMVIMVGGLLVAFCGVTGFALSRGNSLTFVSGAWSALALDAAEGTIYRPIESDLGFGGTRYMPLQFLLHGLVMRAGVEPIVAGHATAIFGVLVLISALAALMIRLGVPATLAIGASFVLLASYSAFGAVTEIRGDALAAGLNFWGLFFCVKAVREERAYGALLPAAVCFTLAFATKITALYGPAIGCGALLLGRRYRAASVLAGLTALGLVTAITAIHVASDGWALATMRACASGGSSVKYTLQAPLRMAVHLLAHDPLILACLLVCGAALLAMPTWERWRELPTVAFVLTLGATLVIFGTPGTSNNHFIDVHAAAIVFGAFQVARGRVDRRWGCSFIAIVAACAALGFFERYRDSRAIDVRANVRSTLAIVDGFGNPDRPLMSEDSTVPIMAGERPYVADSWMLRVLSDNFPQVQQRVARELAEHRYRAVLLCHDPFREDGAFLEQRVFGRGFLAHLNEHYELHGKDGRFWIYRPKQAGSADRPDGGSRD